MEEATERIKTRQPPNIEDIYKLADAMAPYPGSLASVVSDDQFRLLQRVSAPQAGLLLRRFMVASAMNRAVGQVRKAAKERAGQ